MEEPEKHRGRYDILKQVHPRGIITHYRWLWTTSFRERLSFILYPYFAVIHFLASAIYIVCTYIVHTYLTIIASLSKGNETLGT